MRRNEKRRPQRVPVGVAPADAGARERVAQADREQALDHGRRFGRVEVAGDDERPRARRRARRASARAWASRAAVLRCQCSIPSKPSWRAAFRPRARRLEVHRDELERQARRVDPAVHVGERLVEAGVGVGSAQSRSGKRLATMN